MVGISSPGIGSGLDVSTIVSSLVEAEIQPKAIKLDRREASAQSEISSLGQLKGAMTALQSSMTSLMAVDDFQARNTNVSDSSIFTATASTTAAINSYQIEVQQLATQHSLSSASFTDSSQAIGSGTLSIEFGSYDAGPTTFTPNPDKTAQNIIISSGNNSMTGIRDTINAADIGVTAAILEDANGARLVLSSDDTGEKNALKITVTDDDTFHTDNAGLSQLVFDPVGGTSNLTENVEAKDSIVKINGLTLNNSSNKLDSSVDGLTINLLTAKPGTNVSLDVTQNTGAALAKVSSFVSKFNDVLTTIESLSGYNPDTKVGGPLQGDANIRSLKLQLRRMITEPVEHLSGNIRSLVDIGVKTNESGLLSLDNTAFTEAVENNFDEIGRLFARGAYTSDPLIRVRSTAKGVPTGVHNINITSLNLGTSMEGSIAGVSASSEDGIVLAGSANFTGLSLTFLGGSTGNRGTVTAFEGLAVQLDSLLDNYIGLEGSLITRTENLENQVKEIADDRSALGLKSASIEKRYLKQFSALDTLLAQLQNTSAFLTDQLDNIPKIGQSKK